MVMGHVVGVVVDGSAARFRRILRYSGESRQLHYLSDPRQVA
jgi:hypothetical protein